MFQLYDAYGPVEAIREKTAITVGVFDGVHRGHQHLLTQLATCHPPLANMAVTLTSHPSFVLGRRASEYWLDDPQEHLHLLIEAGVQYVAVLPFTHEVSQMSACQMARLLFERLNMRALLLGYDSRFGSKSNDDFDRLPSLAESLGFTLLRGTPYTLDGLPVSSSRIRETLLNGAVHATAALLGRHYTVRGVVQHGRGVGHTLGFPTANVSLSDTRKMLPAEGVYAVRLDGHKGIANLGTAPTFGIENQTLEVFLTDFNGDLYNKEVEVAFLHRLRDIERFDSPDALQAQLHQDLISAKEWL